MAAVGRLPGGRIVRAVMRGHGISARSIRRGLKGGGGHGFVFVAARGIPSLSLGLARKLPRNLRVSFGRRVGRSLGAASFAARCGRFRGTGLGGSLAGDLIKADCGVRFELNTWKLKTDSASSACSALFPPLRAAGGIPWRVGNRVQCNKPVADRRCPPELEVGHSGGST